MSLFVFVRVVQARRAAGELENFTAFIEAGLRPKT